MSVVRSSLMSKNSIPAFNSPIPQTYTPIRRLGLSRKRKKCHSEEKLDIKLQAHVDDLADTPTSSHFKQAPVQNEEIVAKHLDNSIEKNIEDNVVIPEVCEELGAIKKRIEEKEKRLKSLHKQQNRILELENLIEIWKNGCKNVYLYLIEILKNKENENFDSKKMLENLGIWNTMVEIFENDPDISLVENSN